MNQENVHFAWSKEICSSMSSNAAHFRDPVSISSNYDTITILRRKKDGDWYIYP